MRALLLKQQQKHRCADAAGSSLCERLQRQEHQEQAAAHKWQWSKTHGRLRHQQTLIEYELRQILASQEIVDLECGDAELQAKIEAKGTAARESACKDLNKANAVIRDEKAPALQQAAKSTTINKIQPAAAEETPAAVALAGSTRVQIVNELPLFKEETESDGKNASSSISEGDKEQNNCSTKDGYKIEHQTAVSILASKDGNASGRVANLFHSSLSLVHSLRLWKQTVRSALAIPATSSTQKPAAPMQLDDRLLLFSLGTESGFENPWQAAGCLFPLIASLLQADGTSLEQIFASVAAEADAALADVREAGGMMEQNPAAAVQLTRAKNHEGGLTDTEDSILCGEASQVRAAREAETALAKAGRRGAGKGAGKAFEKLRCAASSPRTTVVNTGERVGRRGSMHSLSEEELAKYSRRLTELEEKYARELQCYRQQIVHHRSSLRLLAAGLALLPAGYNYSAAADSSVAADAHTITSLQSSTPSITFSLENNNNPSPAQPMSDARPLTPSSTESRLLTKTSAASLPVTKNASQLKANLQERAENTKAVATVLVIVRWLWAATRSAVGMGEGQNESLLQNLRLAFPHGREKTIRAVLQTQQQLGLLQQRQLTCRREWMRARQRELRSVSQKLERIASRSRELTKSSLAAAVLKERRSWLSEQLMQQKKRREAEELQLAATEKELREAQQAVEQQRAEREKTRRQKEKECIVAFQRRKLLEAQQQQQKAAEEVRAAREPLYVQIVRAARISRRQEQHRLRLFEQQLERQERQLQMELMQQRLAVAAERLKPLVTREPLRVLKQTAASQSHAAAGQQQMRELQQQQQHLQRLSSFEVQHCYSCDTLMKDIRFRLSMALAERQLINSQAAQELLIGISQPCRNNAKSSFP